MNVEQSVLFDLLLAADYLNIPSLLLLTSAKVASMIKGLSLHPCLFSFVHAFACVWLFVVDACCLCFSCSFRLTSFLVDLLLLLLAFVSRTFFSPSPPLSELYYIYL